MPVLTFTTDWGNSDPCLPALKGELLSSIPGLLLVDISNEIEKFDIMHGAYVLRNSCFKFPAGTIHFVGMTGNENPENDHPYVIVESEGHYFIGYDSGIFSLVLGESKSKVYRLPLTIYQEREKIQRALTDHLISLTKGSSPSVLGKEDGELTRSFFSQPTVDPNSLRGAVMYIDAFGNVVLNITKELFNRERKDREFTIRFRNAGYSINKISLTYEETEVGEMIGLFNAEGYLEIALNKAEASKLLGLKLMDPVRVEFQ